MAIAGSQTLTLVEVVAGTVVTRLPRVPVSLGAYPKLSQWCDRLVGRPSWQASEVSAEALAAFKSVIAARQQQTSGS
ncbi:MAG: hypothetical protein HC825_11450 [Oscillatoriales cyanobacterium RM1_1_9]|nr:hypothetical protein [Oscillatoriales cyanobacterium RM1_1_9]